METVSKGLGTWVGFGAAAAAAIAPLVGELADAAAPLGVPPQTWVIVSALLTAATVIGRMWQAAAANLAGGVTLDAGQLTDPPPTDPGDVPIGDAQHPA